MALVVKDRVKVTTSTTGTGTLTLGSAVTKFQDFSVIGDGNTTYYAIESGNGTDWEVGVGTYTASGTTLSRDTILESSNAGSAINLSGTSTVFCTYPAERSVNTADIGTTIQAYDATILKSADIGSTVQGYDADTAKYDDTTANFTGTLQNGGSNVVVDSDIGSTVQAYDADTTKNDVANTFTANQTINGDLTVDTNTLFVDSTNNRVGIGTTSPNATLQVQNGLNTIMAGADSSASTLTDATQKVMRFGVPHYTNAEENVCFSIVSNTSGENGVLIGGGTGTFNAATRISFHTAANTTTTSGSERMRIDSSGNLLVNTTTSNGAKVVAYQGASQSPSTSGNMTTGFIFGQGSGSATLNFGIDSDGVWYNAAYANNAGVSRIHRWLTGGSEKMRIDTSGNVGIGTSSPSSDGPLSIQRDGAGACELNISLINGVSNKECIVNFGNNLATADRYKGRIFYQTDNNIMGFWTNASERMRIDSSGNVGIGTSSPATKLDVSGVLRTTSYEMADAAGSYASATNGYRILASGSDVYFDWFNAGAQIFRTNGANERMRITSSGEVYIAGTTDQGAYNLQCNGTGVWGAGAYVNGSDERIKENIISLDSGLDVIAKLNPVTYKYKEDWSKDQSTQTGFIAQELLVALEGKNYADGIVQQGGEYMSVAYQNIIPLLTKAIQEQQDIIKTLETRIQTLENN